MNKRETAEKAAESAWDIPLADPPYDYTDDGSALCLLADAEDAIEDAIRDATAAQQKVIKQLNERNDRLTGQITKLEQKYRLEKGKKARVDYQRRYYAAGRKRKPCENQ